MSTRSSLVSFSSGTEMPAVIIVTPTLPANSLCLVNSSISTLLAIYYKGEDKLCLNFIQACHPTTRILDMDLLMLNPFLPGVQKIFKGIYNYNISFVCS